MAATTPRSREWWARRGLASRRRIDRTTQAMLLRQLYLSHFEQRRFRAALLVSEQGLALDVLADVVHQDAARAAVALGELEIATQHLRLAARAAPPSRRAFHWWTLGSVLYLGGRSVEAIGALERAVRWGTRDKPLYQGHWALARIEAGQSVDGLEEIIEALASVPSGQGYGRFVLGLLSLHANRRSEARKLLGEFVARTENARAATTIALSQELERARATLASLREAV
jgi:tetratricopeptide (TPR) repeat protein